MVFGQNLKNFDFGKKGFHLKGHLKRNRMTQISASYHLPVRSYEENRNIPISKTPYVFGQKLMEPISANKDTIRKGILRGAE